MQKLRVSYPHKEGILEVSKWRSYQILLEKEEMEELFSFLSPFYLLNVSQVLDEKKAIIPQKDFIDVYSAYIEYFKNKSSLEDPRLKPYFSSQLTSSLDTHYLTQVKPGKFLVKGLEPSIQLQSHFFLFTKEGKFLSMTHGKECTSWGIQFSYPQISRHPKTREIFEVLKTDFPNNELFKALGHWLKEYTRPTLFMINGQKKMAPFRIGKNASQTCLKLSL